MSQNVVVTTLATSWLASDAIAAGEAEARPFDPAEYALAARAREGDRAAQRAVYELYAPKVRRFVADMLRSRDAAADAVQDTFVRLYRALPRYEERQKFESWLFQILGNCCRTANSAFRRDAGRTVDDERALERVPSSDLPSAALDNEWGDAVRRALADVPDYNREIFLLHYIEGFSYEEIERNPQEHMKIALTY